MEKYTASNGVIVDVHDTAIGQRISAHDRNPAHHPGFPKSVDVKTYLDPRQADALREFFRAERDEELGRWRWPANPEYVVYPRADHVQVVNEASGNALKATRAQANDLTGLGMAALAYFEAHPERKPWHDAKPGEVWYVVPNGNAWVLESGAFMFDDESFLFAKDIRDARRIWPEDAA